MINLTVHVVISTHMLSWACWYRSTGTSEGLKRRAFSSSMRDSILVPASIAVVTETPLLSTFLGTCMRDRTASKSLLSRFPELRGV